MQCGDGAQSLERQTLGDEGEDRLDTESLYSHATDAAVGDDELPSCENDNDNSSCGHPREQDKDQTGLMTQVVDDYGYHGAKIPNWAYRYNDRHENGNVGWAFANSGARAKCKAKQANIKHVT